MISSKRIRDKYRVCEKNRAKLILAAIRMFPDDDISVRMADINNEEALLAQDIYYHKPCVEKLLSRYYRNQTVCTLCSETVDKQYHLLSVEEVKSLLDKSRANRDIELAAKLLGKYNEERGCIISFIYAHSHCKLNYLSSDDPCKIAIYEIHVILLIEDLLSKEYGITLSQIREFVSERVPGVTFYNHMIKNFLLRRFAGQISFCPPYRKK